MLACKGIGQGLCTRYDDCLDIWALQKIVEGLAWARVFRIKVNIRSCREALGGFEGPRVDGFEGQVFRCLYGRLSIFSSDISHLWKKEVQTK